MIINITKEYKIKMLELKHIRKSYITGDTTQQVLKGINISFRRSEFASILGASGSGKTTLLNIIGSLDIYDEGDLIIEGVSTKKYKSRDWDSYRNHRVGFIFQSYNLISHQTLLSNVELALTLSGVSKKERRKKAAEALSKVGLKEHMHKRPNQLSGGQMQRVAIARALVNDPEIILADEPTGALDSETSIQIMDILKEVAKEKLVIMVTHNPELAKEYSTRIIELKDGMILSDSNPYSIEKENTSPKKTNKTSMSLLTFLGLSFNNLLTKKGRTILTAFAGSIGIVGIALILSLSNGVSNYVADMERDSLSNYPISLEENSYDYSKLLGSSNNEDDTAADDGKLHSKDDITSTLALLTNDIIKKNNLEEFKKYLDENNEIKDYASEIKYGYNLDLQIYSDKNDEYTKINTNGFNLFENASLDKQEGPVSISSENQSSPVFEELLDNEELLETKYDVIAGTLPKDYNELVLVIGKDNVIPDSILYALDIKDRKKLTSLLNKINNKEEVSVDSTAYSYDDILNLSYKLVLNTDYYKYENGVYMDYSNDTNHMNEIVSKGLPIKVVGILRAKDDTDSTNVIGYKHSLTEYVINNISKTDLYKEQVNNKKINILTGEEFDNVINTYESNCKMLGIADINNPSKISIYPKNFDSKEKVISLIDDYNNKQKENNRTDLIVTYTDLIKTMVSSITSVINMVSFVLIGFVAISLIVSSIMIAIITYISVLERTKEIGILRAIGASKKDVSTVFKAETIIEGFIAGILGVATTLLLCIPINAIVASLTDIDKIASLSLKSAVSLIILSVLLTLVAGLIPSKMASKKKPVEALRSE